MANSNGEGLEGQWGGKMVGEKKQPHSSKSCEAVCVSKNIAGSKVDKEKFPLSTKGDTRTMLTRIGGGIESVDDWKKTVSEMGKCSDGLPHQLDRLKSLGNAVVPIQAKEAFEVLIGIK